MATSMKRLVGAGEPRTVAVGLLLHPSHGQRLAHGHPRCNTCASNVSPHATPPLVSG